tara:strand:+ start:7104 stop:7946 length:843 start_codon:yes stop_codon:yes gene_type:complete
MNKRTTQILIIMLAIVVILYIYLKNKGEKDNRERSGENEVLGCTSQGANNYNSLATKDDGSCQYGECGSTKLCCDRCVNGYATTFKYDINNEGAGMGNCPAGEIPTGSGNPCVTGVTCYKCQNDAVVSQTYPQLSVCPEKAQSEDPNAFPTCGNNPKVSGNIDCDSCVNGYVTTQSYSGSTCPANTVPSGSGNPCSGSGSNNGVVCDGCQNGAPVSQTFYSENVNGVGQCPSGWLPTGTGDPCAAPSSVCHRCHNGYPESQIFASASCPAGWSSVVASNC